MTRLAGMCAAISIAVSTAGCSKSYADLETAFAVEQIKDAPALPTHTLAVSSRRHRGIELYSDTVTIHLSPDAIEIENSAPFRKSIRIPASEIAGCGMTCFGTQDQHVDLLIPKTESDIHIARTDSLMDWCWNSRKPMFSGVAKRMWKYAGFALPPPEAAREALKSRHNYNEQAMQSCLGY